MYILMHPWTGIPYLLLIKNLILGIEIFKIFGQVLEFLTMCDVSDPTMNWVHMSKNQVAREMDVSSCMMKSMAVVHL